jgi:glycerol uptake facilitator-like aquaporin
MVQDESDTPAPCFFEQSVGTPLWRRGFVECIGMLLLTVAALDTVSLAGQAGADRGAGLIASAIATAGALVSLIVAFGPVSGGHFNPLITMLQWLGGERSFLCTVVYCFSQLVGGALGGLIAGRFSVRLSPGQLSGSLLTSELLCSAALMLVVFACSRSMNRSTGPFAVGAWLAAAIIATPSASVANPAIAVAAVVAFGITSASVHQALVFSAVEVLGAWIALILVSIAYPRDKVSSTR